VQVVYRPDKNRIYYKGARINLFGLPTLPCRDSRTRPAARTTPGC
jgi:hypothetical protein